MSYRPFFGRRYLCGGEIDTSTPTPPTDIPTPVLPTEPLSPASLDDSPVPPASLNQIVFASRNSIYTVDVSSRKLTKLAHVDEQVCCPVWSPNRQKIAVAIQWGMYHGVYVINFDGSDLKRLAYIRRTDGGRPSLAPVWSEDSQQIDFVYGAYGYGGINSVTSPDGKQLAFVESWIENHQTVGELYVKNIDGTNETQFTTALPAIFGIDW